MGSTRLKRRGGSTGGAMENLRCLLADQHRMHSLTHIIFEAQHIGARVDPQTVYLLIGMGAMVEWFAERIGAVTFCVDIGTWRKHFLGVGNLKRDEAKKRCIDKCNLLGWHPPDDNAADACGVLDFYLSLLERTPRGITRPWRDADLLKGYRK